MQFKTFLKHIFLFLLLILKEVEQMKKGVIEVLDL